MDKLICIVTLLLILRFTCINLGSGSGFKKKKKNHSLPESQMEHYKMGLVELPYMFVMASLTTQLTWTACCRCPEGNNRLTVHWGWAGSVLDTRCGDPR